MSVQFLSTELDKWDETKADALVLTMFADERPLRGAAGLADWRLCGRISELIKKRRLEGDDNERLLMPPGARLPFGSVFVFGLGTTESFNEAGYREHVRRILAVLRAAKISSFAMQPPGRATGLIAARRALEIWVEESEKAELEGETFIVDTPGAQKEMADILHAYQRRAAAKR